jgi:GNAT superfamily N-acetyltransferase
MTHAMDGLAPVRIEMAEQASPTDIQTIFLGLRAATERMSGPSHLQPLTLLLRNDAGTVIGGLTGRTVYGWLLIEMLYVPESLWGCGLGTALMQTAEAEARRRGCIGVQLDTFGQQAPAFYRRLGFTVFGELVDHPPGQVRLFMAKRLSLDCAIAGGPGERPASTWEVVP